MKRSHDGDELHEARADLLTAPLAYDKPFPFFRKPSVVGTFSLDANRQFRHDRSQIKYYKPRSTASGHDPSGGATYRVDIDLNEGLGRVQRKDEDECAKEGLGHLLRWILLNRQKFTSAADLQQQQQQQHVLGGAASASPPGGSTLNTDFVCFRGCLTTVMCSPFEGREDWRISAVRYRGTIYLHKEETREQREQRKRRNDRQKAMCSWGYKFEQQMLGDTPAEAAASPPPPRHSSYRGHQQQHSRHHQSSSSSEVVPVNECEEFCCVFRTRLGKHSVVYGAEMDGVAVSDSVLGSSGGAEALDLNREEFVELKTTKDLDHPGQERNFRRFKLIKWWCQSFLVGIGTVVAGFRDDAGRVTSVAEYPVREIPRQCADHWKPNVCVNFLHEFLGHVRESMMGEGGDLREVRFYWSPRLRRVVREEGGVDFGGQRILPDWFVQNVFAGR